MLDRLGLPGGGLAIDLGTSNTVVIRERDGIVLDEPSAVAIDRHERVVAVGREAKRMLGRTPPHVAVARPLREGVVADLGACEAMLREFLRRVHDRRWIKPRVAICVPSGVTSVERRAVQEVAESVGARRPVHVIEEAIAAAIGVGLPVHEPVGNVIVDIGGGTTEVAVISLGGIVAAVSARVGGDAMDQAIIAFAKNEYELALGERTAEHVKVDWGSACELREELYVELMGSHMRTGLPRSVTVSTAEIRDALAVPIAELVEAVRGTLDEAPAELVADALDRGIVITGGGALLFGLEQRLEEVLDLPVATARQPLHATALGTAAYLSGVR